MHRRLVVGVVCCGLVAGPASDAAAQAHAPTFATMDRMDGESHLGAQLGVVFLDNDGPDDFTPVRLDLYGQFVSHGGLGGYGLVPISTSFSEGDDDTAIGNIEGGVFFIIARRDLELVLRGGITLPTADDDLSGMVTNVFAVLSRITDAATALPPQTLWARLSVSPVLRSGQFVLRADAGLDVALSSDADELNPLDSDEPDPFLRLNVGGGIDTGAFAGLAELVTIGQLDDNDDIFDDTNGDDFTHTLAVSGRFGAGALEPGVALVFPLEDDLSDFYDLALVFSLEGRI